VYRRKPPARRGALFRTICGKIEELPRFPRATTLAGVAAFCCAAAGPCLTPTPALAQPPRGPGAGSGGDELDLGRVTNAVVEMMFSLVRNTQDTVFHFLETVELLDFETEIDRLVGDPRELNDSTAYKLSLLPFHIQYPIYQQLVDQMTRQDDLRSQRIYGVTPDSVNIITLRLQSLADDDVKDEVRSSLLHHFSVREIVDLGFFILAQQKFFPDTDEGWHVLKKRIARGGAAVAVGALLAGAAFNLGALGSSGTVDTFAHDRVHLGWYASIRRIGLEMRPQLRGGLTLGLPSLELAAGIIEHVRPDEGDYHRALELALREGWLNQIARASGWDAFFEAALSRVLSAPDGYETPLNLGRAGFFAMRDYIPGFKNFSLRGSIELQTDFERQLSTAVGLGFQHATSGLTTVLQASRTPVPYSMGSTGAETRGGIFFAGTMEPPTESFVATMRSSARLFMDEWEVVAGLDGSRAIWEQKLRLLGTRQLSAADARAALAGMGRAALAREERMGRVAALLADYLERRRLAYSISRWERCPDDLHGPLDPAVLAAAREQVFTRLADLSVDLAKAPARFERLHRRYERVLVAMHELEEVSGPSLALEGYRQELTALERAWRRESEQASLRIDAYLQVRDGARRILSAGSTTPPRNPDPLRPGVIHRVAALKTVSLH
jgi:hypothetical protein